MGRRMRRRVWSEGTIWDCNCSRERTIRIGMKNKDKKPSALGRYAGPALMGFRLTVASLLAFAVSRWAGLTQGYPAVITAIIVTQGSLGASVRTMIDRFVGSLGGAVWGVAVLTAFYHDTSARLGLTLAVTLAPLSLLVAMKPAYRPALITAAILIFAPAAESGPLTPAIHRMFGIALGSAVALAVTLLIRRTRAHGTLLDASGQVLIKMGVLFEFVMRPSDAGRNPDEFQKLHDEIRAQLVVVETAAEAATQERTTHLAGTPDSRPFCRTIRRIYHDLAMIGRATADPIINPPVLLVDSTSALSAAITDFLHATGDAIRQNKNVPSLDRVNAALAKKIAAIEGSRKAGYTRTLATDDVSRMFGLEFALDQLQRNLADLAEQASDLQETPQLE
jgi:uncharacterized membrane protein YccC